MRIEQALFNHLSTHPGLSALIGTRVYPVKSPQSPTHPLVIYSQASGPRIRTMGGDQGASPRWQFICEAATYSEAKQVAAQVRAALGEYSGTMGGTGGVEVQAAQEQNAFDDYEPEQKVYQTLLDFIIWHGGES